ncbi:PQQ-binding-like beta-propeller repeat protein [Saliphagus sp. GCM10025334]
MSGYDRRDFLKHSAVAVVLAGSAYSASAVTDGDSNVLDSLPDPEIGPSGANDTWSNRANSGNTKFVEGERTFDENALEVAWTVDAGAEIALDDERVYCSVDDSIAALDPEDGSVQWRNDDVQASNPTVIDDTVYASGDEVYAFDRSDGSLRWESSIGSEEAVSSMTVAYGGIYVVADGVVYGLDAEDGSVRWQIQTITVDGYDGEETYEKEFRGTCAANGVVYASNKHVLFALEPETGEEVWRHHDAVAPDEFHENGAMIVTDSALLANSIERGGWVGLDPITGEHLENSSFVWGRFTLKGSLAVSSVRESPGDSSLTVMDLESGAERWRTSAPVVGDSGVVAGDTLYAYFGYAESDQQEYENDLVAFDLDDGTVQWVLSLSDEFDRHEITAIGDDAIYLSRDRTNNDGIVAIHEPDDDGSGDDGDDEQDDGDESDGDGSDDADGEDDQDDDGDNEDEETSGDDGDDDDDSDGTNDGDTCGCPNDDENDDGEDTTGSDGNVSDDDDETTTDSDDGADGANEAEERTSQTDADESPGFTTGAGIFGGLLGLEWLRRQSNTDEPEE